MHALQSHSVGKPSVFTRLSEDAKDVNWSSEWNSLDRRMNERQGDGCEDASPERWIEMARDGLVSFAVGRDFSRAK